MTNEKTPPMDWFYGVGRKDLGIRIVSTRLREVFGDVIGELIDQYMHHTVNHTPETMSDEGRSIVEEARRKIKAATDFDPQVILDTKIRLAEQYEGKKEAPFKFDLY